MEKELNPNENLLVDLIENYDFFELSEEDKNFVLDQMSQEDYDFQRTIISEAKHVWETNITPKPLEIVSKNKQRKGIVIPLYQAILAVASVIILFILIWPKDQINNDKVLKFSENDTIIQTKIVHDTFVKYIPKINYIEKNVTQTKIEYITINEDKSLDEPRLLDVAQSLNLPPITKELIQNQGNSLKEDQSSKLIKPIFISY
jgi:hypothetical protein